MAKTTILDLLDSQKIDFTENLSDGKILKFPHCDLATLNCEMNTAYVMDKYSHYNFKLS